MDHQELGECNPVPKATKQIRHLVPIHKPYCVFVCGIRELRLDLELETLTNTLGDGRVHLDRTTVSFLSRNLISRAPESCRSHLEPLGHSPSEMDPLCLAGVSCCEPPQQSLWARP